MNYLNRQSLLGLLFAQVGAVLLHLERLPFWLILLAIVIFIWRIQIYRSQWAFPNKIIRGCLVLCSIAAVIGYFSDWYALEPMVVMLVIAFLLKLLEVEYRRDAIVLIFVGYFVTASAYLFDQGIVSTLLGIMVLWLLTACLMVLHGSESRYLSRRTLRTISILLLQSVPIMLLLLFVLPRVGALWSVPVQSSSSVTGVSDSMAPGDFSQLTRSRSLAFRVSFDGELPPSSERYWRGVVLTQFDGRRWQRQDQSQTNQNTQVSYELNNKANKISYEIVLEATNTSWLYGIPYAEVMSNNDLLSSNTNVSRSTSNELILNKPVTQRMQYRVNSFAAYNTIETRESLRQNLLLPRGFNPKTIAQAQQWQRESRSTEAYINKVLRFYNQSFFYTLSPPKLGQNTADEFLFSTQRGFCEHFASSFVILMRAAGIPARVVTGYQGGEWNADGNYLLVRQYDAHAWAEVWLPNRGWTRYDPTAAVAPNRIEEGLLDTLSASDQELLDPTTLPSFAWINRLALKWDGINYGWQRWVLSYDQERQSRWLQNVLGEITATRMAILLVAPVMIMLAFFSFMAITSPKKPIPNNVKLYLRLVAKLRRKGVNGHSGESLMQLCTRAGNDLPEYKVAIMNLAKQISHSLYGQNGDVDKAVYSKVKRQIDSL